MIVSFVILSRIPFSIDTTTIYHASIHHRFDYSSTRLSSSTVSVVPIEREAFLVLTSTVPWIIHGDSVGPCSTTRTNKVWGFLWVNLGKEFLFTTLVF